MGHGPPEASLEILVGARFEQYTRKTDPDHITEHLAISKCYADIANYCESNAHGLLAILRPGNRLKLGWARDIDQGAAFLAGSRTVQLSVEVERLVGST
jgi:hypothetical protein